MGKEGVLDESGAAAAEAIGMPESVTVAITRLAVLKNFKILTSTVEWKRGIPRAIKVSRIVSR